MKKILIYLSVIFSFLVVLSIEEIHNIKGEEIGGTEKNTQYYYDNDDSISLNNYYATHYFYNLKNNFGNNLVGSCAYVALSMLLSFYDTYWDDNIISENFDIPGYITEDEFTLSNESPGTLKENKSYHFENNLETLWYYERVNLYSNQSFHLNLIKLGEESFNYYNQSSSEYPCMLLSNQYAPLIQEYLYEVKNFNQETFQLETCFNEDDVRNFIIERVKLGIPVIGYISKLIEKHYVIFYDYDEANDELYCHFCWHIDQENNYEYNHIRYSSATDFLSIDSAFAFNINIAHNCSNNFKDFNTFETYCSCYFNIHPAHTHSYVRYTNFNNLKHYGLCYCGTGVFLPHIVREGGSICVLCGGVVETGLSTFARNMLANPTNSVIWTDSYILSNGVIVISDGDYKKLLNNEITIPAWEEK